MGSVLGDQRLPSSLLSRPCELCELCDSQLMSLAMLMLGTGDEALSLSLSPRELTEDRPTWAIELPLPSRGASSVSPCPAVNAHSN